MSSKKQNKQTQMQMNANNDWFLQHLIGLVNNVEGAGFSVTLNVGGILISGTMVGGKEYFQGFAQEFSVYGGPKEEDQKQTEETMALWGKIYDKPQDGEDVPPPSYVHLRNAKFFNTSGNPIPANRGVWWRGKVSAIDGFLLGALSPSND